MESTGYSIRLECVDFRTCALHYKQSGRYLTVYLEQSAIPEFDWVGLDSDFQYWTVPSIQTSEQERKLILGSLELWCSQNGIKISIGPPADWKQWLV